MKMNYKKNISVHLRNFTKIIIKDFYNTYITIKIINFKKN